MRRLNGTSLLEVMVAGVVFLSVFALVMELLPHLAVREDDALLQAEVDYRIGRVYDKYSSGLWPAGEYAESYDWGDVTVEIEPYREKPDVQVITVTARIAGSRTEIVYKQLIQCIE